MRVCAEWIPDILPGVYGKVIALHSSEALKAIREVAHDIPDQISFLILSDASTTEL